ncbi:MAG: tetrahydrofolate dehydrogenase/cyclohydrolase catalytic domain-containing protein [Microscillaceae bacterium]|nr:tetrahydrofolate dehydrogenase/cyclohydrolase catalytic domain-containing protein [Microscillaceae bacterium]
MQIIDGKQTALDIQEEIALEVANMKSAGQKVPHLAAILVGNDAPSETYVNHKVIACQRVGFESSLFKYDTISEAGLLEKIEEINQNSQIDGLIVQLPLPDEIDPIKIVEHISPAKDVDGLHPVNVGRMVKGLPAYISATPLGITMLLEKYQIETSGKHCVVIGRSQLVGSPMSVLMARNHRIGNATVTLCHSRTQNISAMTRQADILIVAIGRAHFVTADMVKEGAIVIDVGTNRVDDPSKKSGYRLTGDVDFEGVKQIAAALTPVPGGVGPMTITGLLYNTLLAAQKKIYA